MNYWDYQDIDDQTFSITPREGVSGGGVVPFTADTTLYTADTTLYTADQTEISSGSSYIIEYTEDGSFDKLQASAVAVQNGSFLDLTATLTLNKDSFYYFRVFIDDVNGKEIFRGKSFTYDVLPSQPLHYSMYNDNEID